jgi:hypothetical protein
MPKSGKAGGDIVRVLFAKQAMRGKRRSKRRAQERFDVAVERGDRAVLLFTFEFELQRGSERVQREPAGGIGELDRLRLECKPFGFGAHVSKTPIAR